MDELSLFRLAADAIDAISIVGIDGVLDVALEMATAVGTWDKDWPLVPKKTPKRSTRTESTATTMFLLSSAMM
jgi:hypothetical protein